MALFALLSATAGLASSTVTLAATKAAAAAFTAPARLLNKKKEHKALGEVATAAASKQPCLAVMPFVVVAQEQEIGVSAPADITAAFNKASKAELGVVESAAVAGGPAIAASLEEEADLFITTTSTSWGAESAAEDAALRASWAGEDAVFATVHGASGSQRQCDAAIAFFQRLVAGGDMSVADAQALAIDRAMGALAAEWDRCAEICGYYEAHPVSSTRRAGEALAGAAGAALDDLADWALGDPQAHMVACVGVQAGLLVGAAALGALVVVTAAVGGLALLSARAAVESLAAAPRGCATRATRLAAPAGAVAPPAPPAPATITLPIFGEVTLADLACAVRAIARETVSTTAEVLASHVRGGPTEAELRARDAADQAAWAAGGRRFVY